MSARAVAAALAVLLLVSVGIGTAGGAGQPAPGSSQAKYVDPPVQGAQSRGAARRRTVVGRYRQVRSRRSQRGKVGLYPQRGAVRPPPAGEADEQDAAPAVPPTTDPDTPPGVPRIRAAAAGDFTVFRNTVTAADGRFAAIEPNASNDRFGILATGNRFAVRSADNGLSFPESRDLDVAEDDLFGGICCDQLSYAVDRGSSSLIFWLRQYYYDEDAEQNALRLNMFRGTSDLLDGTDPCEWELEPQDLGLPDGRWFDFNQMSHTSKYLYITTNQRDTNNGDLRVGSMVFRIALTDLDDGNCSVSIQYWRLDGEPQNARFYTDTYLSPVDAAGTTMYFASHITRGTDGDQLLIYSIADSSNVLEQKDRNVDNFKDITGICPLPNSSTNHCADQHPGRMSGFRSGSTIGWLWQADQSNNYPFPYVRVAWFETGTLNKLGEHQIWNSEYAWQLPSVGVNASGDLGVVLYRMGGNNLVKARGFIRTDPRDWSGISTTGLSDSDSPYTPDEPDDAAGWGHFGSVREYGNCPDTFLSSVYTTKAGVNTARMVWFGAEQDGCIDLAATAVSKDGAGPFTPGGTMGVSATIQNQGSKAAPASSISYYLSRDEVLDEDDTRFDATRTAAALDPADSYALHATLVVPGTGVFHDTEFFLIVCGDDPAALGEITETNNCKATTSTFVVESSLVAEQREDVDYEPSFDALRSNIFRAATPKAGGNFLVSEAVVAKIGRIDTKTLPTIRYSMSRIAGRDDDEIDLTATTLSRGKGTTKRSGRVIRRLKLPKTTPRGRYRLVGCLRHKRGNEDRRGRNDCRIGKRVIVVGGSSSTKGPRRRGFFRGE